MSFQTDRHWRAYLWAAFLVGVIGGALPLVSLTAFLPPPLAPGELPAAALFTMGMVAAALAALLALLLAGRGVRGWRRMQRRNQALHGDPNALPESTIQPDATDVFDVAHEPLVLVWRMERSSAGVVTSPFDASFGGVAHALAHMLTLYLVLFGLLLVGSRWFPALASSTLLSWAIFIVGLAAIGPVVIEWLVRRWLTSDQLTIVAAFAEGIRFQPIRGSVRLMHWEDMRLLEVEERGHVFVTRYYALYDRQQAVISWVEWGAKKMRVPQPEDLTWDDMWALSRELVDVIYQHTGLVPRTLSRSLRRGPAAVPERMSLGGAEAQEYPGTHA